MRESLTNGLCILFWCIYFANSGQKWEYFGKGNRPVDEWGCKTELLDDDGSSDFTDLYENT